LLISACIVQTASGDAARYKGLADTLVKTVRYEGIRGLYKGFGAVIAATAPAHALYFMAYEASKAVLPTSPDSALSKHLVHFAAGVMADVGGSLVWVPMDVVKQRLQAQDITTAPEHRYRHSLHTAATIVRTEGVLGLYRGFAAGLATYGPFCGLYFVLYEEGKQRLAAWQGRSTLGAQLACGLVSGAIAAAVTNPLDVIKTRLQVHGRLSAHAYTGIGNALVRIVREEGWRAFGKGMQARVSWIAPGTAITIGACTY
jgi:hypothetical protein